MVDRTTQNSPANVWQIMTNFYLDVEPFSRSTLALPFPSTMNTGRWKLKNFVVSRA